MDFEKLKKFVENLNNEQRKELAEIIEQKKELTGYEKPGYGQVYYCLDRKNNILEKVWEDNFFEKMLWRCGNVFTREDVAQNKSKARTLMDRLERFAKLNNKEEIDWNDKSQLKYSIINSEGEIEIVNTSELTHLGQVYFSEIETAKKAIEKFRNELEWYYKKYQ